MPSGVLAELKTKSENAESVQKELLLSLIKKNAGTEYGKKYDFDEWRDRYTHVGGYLLLLHKLRQYRSAQVRSSHNVGYRYPAEILDRRSGRVHRGISFRPSRDWKES